MTARTLLHRFKRADIPRLRDLTEGPDPSTRHQATLELIARGHYLAYSDARHAALLALTGAHAKGEAA